MTTATKRQISTLMAGRHSTQFVTRLSLCVVLLCIGALPIHAAAQNADLVLNHNVNPSTVGATETVQATVTIENNGPNTSNNIVMTYALPASAEYVSHVTSAGSCVADPAPGGSTQCDVGNLLVSGVATITFNFRVNDSTPAAIQTTASVISDTNDPDLANNSLSRNITVESGADLAMSATASPGGALISGSALDYILSVSNNGPDSATSVAVVTQLPSGFLRSGSLPAGCSQAGQVVTCNRAAALSDGGVWNVGTISGVITAASPSNLVLQSTAGSALVDGVTENDTAQVTTSVTPGSDVYLGMSQSPGGTRVVGDNFAIQLTPRYSGDVPQNLEMTATIADELEIQNPATFSSNGWSCAVTGQTVACIRPDGGAAAGGEVAIGGVAINVTAIGFGSLANTANITSTSPADPNLANNNASLNVTVNQPDFDLVAHKTGPSENLRVIGDPFNFSIRARNDSNINFVGTLTMTDTLPAGLQVNSLTTNGWTCTDAVGGALAFPVAGPGTILCERTYTEGTPFGANSNTPYVVMVSEMTAAVVAANSMTLTFDPAPGYSYPGETSIGNNTTSVSVTGFTSTDSADLRVMKAADAASVSAGNALTYTITVVNDGPDTAQNVTLADSFPSLFTGSGGNSFSGLNITANDATFTSCTNSSAADVSSRNISCDFASIPPCGGGNPGVCPTIEVTVLPLGSSSNGNAINRTNTASVSSTTTADPNYNNNSGSVTTEVTAETDVTVTKTSSWDGQPDTVRRAGTNLTYVIEAINTEDSSASGAANVTLTDTLPLDVTFISATPTSGSCAITPPGNSTTTGVSRTVECNMGTLGRNTVQTLTIVVRPNNATRGTTLTNSVAVATSTTESNAANNTATHQIDVANPQVDLATTVVDNPDPIQEGSNTTLTVTVRNNGPSVAENVRVFGVLSSTADGMTYQSVNGATCSRTPAVGATGAGATNLAGAYWANGEWDADLLNADIICELGLMNIGAGGAVSFQVVMEGETKGVYSNRFIARSQEHVDNFADPTPGNDFEPENTTVRTSADMQVVSKTATPGTVSLREPFEYEIVVLNAGPGTAYGVTLADTLPTGMTLTAAPTVAANAGPNGPTTVASCTGAAGENSFSCDFGDAPVLAQVTLTVPVRVTTWPASGTLTNTATVAVDTTQTNDPVPGNNSNTGPVDVNRSSLAGRVYEDTNFNGDYAAPEPGINNVQMRLAGTDDFGNAVNVTATTNSTGVFTFNNLSPSTNGVGGGYTLTQTQPAAYLDGYEDAGSAGGTIASPAPDAAVADVISEIYLAADTSATAYNFGELRAASISGWVFVDSNANDARDGSETAGLPNLTMRLVGTDYTSAAVDRTVQTGVAGGNYSFTNVLPGTYTVIQDDIPVGMAPTGPQVGTVSGTASGTAQAAVLPATPPELQDVVLISNGEGINYNFGWTGQTLGGVVYVDIDRSGVFNAGDRTLAGVEVVMSGLTSGGVNVCSAIAPQPCTVTSQADGSYSFYDIPASNAAGYTLTQQSTSTAPLSDYGDGPINVGTVGGTVTGASAANAIGSITLNAGQSGQNYNFGHLAARLSGTVFYDQNKDGVLDTPPADTPLAGVQVTLSGQTVTGQNICTLIGAAACAVTTDANGQFVFDGLAGSNGTGFTLVQTQPVDYASGINTVGGEGGTLGTSGNNVQVSQIVVPGGSQDGIGYLFAHVTGGLSGFVYNDENADSARGAAEERLEGIEITLSGTTASGTNVCSTVDSCTTTTAADGSYSFDRLRNANATGYTITRGAVPADFINGNTGTGLVDGVACAGCTTASAIRIATVPYAAGSTHTDFDFLVLKPATLEGFLYIDADSNGDRDAEDTSGLPNLTVRLTGNNYLGNAITAINVQSAATDPFGYFRFENLEPGTYTVQQIGLPGGLSFTGYDVGTAGGTEVAAPPYQMTGVTLASEDEATGYHFGWSGQGLSGAVYLDVNRNGSQDAGEPGLGSVSITLSGTTSGGLNVCDVIAPNPCTVTTQADGSYVFSDVPASNGAGYTLTQQAVTAAPLDGFAPGTNSVGQVGGTTKGALGTNAINGIVVGAGEIGFGYLFGHYPLGEISGTAYYDVNDNGQQDGGEPGLDDVTMRLSGTTLQGTDVCTLVTCEITTDANGYFEFAGLPFSNAAGYTVTQTQPSEYSAGTHSTGSSAGTFSASGNNTVLNGIVLDLADYTEDGYRFAHITGVISGFVYHDVNANAARDSGEPRLAGIPIELSGTTILGTDICTVVTCNTVTDADGRYQFAGLHNADANGYTIRRGSVPGYLTGTSSGRINGAACNTCDTNNGTIIGSIPMVASNTHTEFNFSVVQITGISGRVYRDDNRDETFNPGEELPGVTVTLTGQDYLGGSVNRVAVTDENGIYVFENVQPSDSNGYTVTETQPEGLGDFDSNGAQAGTVDGVQTGTGNHPDSISGIVLSSNSVAVEYNFRNTAASISGYSYVDHNHNGVKDPSEPGIEGVRIVLTGTSETGDAVSMQVTSDSGGAFEFKRLLSGTYRLEEQHPEGYVDGYETAGSAGGETDNSGFGIDARYNRIQNIVVEAGERATDYLFGNRNGLLTGFVYVDENDNGVRDEGEEGIAGIDIHLSGTSVTGDDIRDVLGCATQASNCTATTDADGSFSFVGVGSGNYTLVQNHNQVSLIPDTDGNQKYADGRETAGVAGGAVDNSAFGSQDAYNTIAGIRITDELLATHSGEIGGYLFGERPRSRDGALVVPPVISGYVYFDRNHDRVRPTPVRDTRVEGWGVALVSTKDNGITETVCRVETNDMGYYELNNLTCNASGFPRWVDGLPVTGDASPEGGVYDTFDIIFEGEGGLAPLAQSGGDVGEPDAQGGRIVRIQLRPGDDLVEQNLPLDPAGVVYDARTRQPVAGATVTILNNGSPVLESCLVGKNPVVTGDNGFYQFLLWADAGCPGSGRYELQVVPPAGYSQAVSTLIPPTAGPLVPPITGVFPVQPQDMAPAEGLDTTYYLDFDLTITGSLATSSADVVNNHIPIDPLPEGAIQVLKSTPRVNVGRGDLVPYSIQVINTVAGTTMNLSIEDRLPPGFRYVEGSARIDGVAEEPEVLGGSLRWAPRPVSSEQPVVAELLLVVGSAVSFGEHVNQAWAMLASNRLSNIAEATVRVIPDPIFDCTDIIGRVYDDANRNGYQDEGEAGIAGVRVVTPNGLLVTTDAHGRYHIACADVPSDLRGGNFILKLDDRTLPSGYRVTTENPRVVRITQGRMTRANFGAAIHRVIRLDLTDAAFDSNNRLLPEFEARLVELIPLLQQEPSILRVAYHLPVGARSNQAREGIAQVRKWLEDNWEGDGCCYDLLIEDEIVAATEQVEVIR